MKKFLLMLLVLTAAIPGAMAQNANRSGFFLETAVGGITGSTPAIGYSAKDGKVSAYCLSGTAVNFALGFRRATARHWAYEFRMEGQTNTDDFERGLTAKLLPVGFRYTSPELFRNYSLFFHFNVGGAIGAVNVNPEDVLCDSDNSGYDYDQSLTNNSPRTDAKAFDNISYGAAYELGIGVNLSIHFYVEALWDSQVMLDTFGKEGKKALHWGMVGARIGYRF